MRYDYESGVSIAIDDSSMVGEARRTAAGAAAAAGLNDVEAGRLAIIATEAATNIAKHAVRGEMMVRSLMGPGKRGVDVIALDSGPGIGDLERALRDGFSTAGSSGTGLGAMARLATEFDIFTAPGVGTVLAARVESDRSEAGGRSAIDVGVVRVAKRGESACGDDWGCVVDDRGRIVIAVADGLGHGPSAADASRRAIEIARDNATDAAALIVAAMHRGLRPTRGAAVAVGELDPSARTVRYAGLGNISASIVGPGQSKSLMSHNGIAGHEMRKIQEFPYDWPAGSLLIIHSDGLTARWDLGRYPGLTQRHPSVVAGVLYRDFSRGRDDSLVVVVRAAT